MRKVLTTLSVMILVFGITLSSFAWTVSNDDNNKVWFPDKDTFNSSTPGSAWWVIQDSDGNPRLMQEANVRHPTGGVNGDAFDTGSLSGIAVSESDTADGFLNYSPTKSQWQYAEVGADMVATGPELVVNDVAVQHKVTFFGDGEHVARTEILLTAQSATTRVIRTYVNLGSDGSTVVQAQYKEGVLSNNDITEDPNSQTAIANAINENTQWIMTSDTSTRFGSSDPVIGYVLRGSESSAVMTWRQTPRVGNPSLGDTGRDNVQIYYGVQLPAGETVSLVQFFKLHAYNGPGVGAARFSNWLDEMSVFNTFNTGSPYFQNLTSNVVMNWAIRSEVIVVQKPKIVPPSAPLQVRAKASGVRAINISWQKPTSSGTNQLSKFQIFRNGNLIATIPATNRTYRDRNLDPDQSYSYRIIAIAGNLKSDTSNNSPSIFPRR